MILNCYIDHCYASADADEKQRFVQLLELQDSELASYIFGGASPASQEMTLLVDKIRNLAMA